MHVISIFLAAAPDQKLYEYGVLGIVVVALGWLGLKMFNILLKDRDKAITDRDGMVQDLFTKVLPSITRNTDVLEARQAIDRELVEVLRESNKQLEANTRAFEEVRFLLNHGNSRSGGG